MDALLLLVPLARARNHKGMGDFHMDRAGRLRRREKSRVAPFVFTGIQMISKRLLIEAPEGPFSTNILWDKAIEQGRCFGAVHQGLWFDVGTPRRSRKPKRRWRMSERVAEHPAVFTIPSHRSFADALAAGLIRRFGRDPLELARGVSCCPTTARCAPLATPLCARAARVCCCRA